MNRLTTSNRMFSIYSEGKKMSNNIREELLNRTAIAEIRLIDSKPVQVIRRREELFEPIKIIGKMDLSSHLRINCESIWTHINKNNGIESEAYDLQAKHNSFEEDKMLQANINYEERSTDVGKEINEVNSDLSNKKEKFDSISSKSKLSLKYVQDYSENSLEIDANKSNTKINSPIINNRLAVRSDVVNKTLLRSLKRYYTSEFEKLVNCNLHGKIAQKEEVFEKLKQFTIEIYQNDDRFKLPEFKDVTMKDLIFYMGVCINPSFMKKCTGTPQERNKYQNFYNCLYKYSHK